MMLKQIVVGTLEILGAIVFAVVLVLLAISHVDLRWVIGLGNSVMIFGLAWYYSRARARDKWYWVSFLALLLMHSAALVAIYSRWRGIPLAYFAICGPVEAAAIYWALLKVTE
jgi:hypothetical protein